MRKLTRKEVDRRLYKKGIVLLDEEYLGQVHKQNFKCLQCGHEWCANVGIVINKSNCPNCSLKRSRHTIDDINEKISDRGIVVIDNSYNRNSEKHWFRCEYGHEWKTKVSHVLSGHGCPDCANCRKLTIPEINKRLKPKGIKFIDKEYYNVDYKHTFRCSNGHTWKAVTDSVLRISGCPRCSFGKASDSTRHSKEHVRAVVESKGYKFLGGYKNSNSRILVVCPFGHKQKIIFSSFQNGQRCAKCTKKKNEIKIAQDGIKKFNKSLEKDGFKYISGEYKNSTTKVLVECPNGHRYKTSHGNFNSGSRCPNCRFPRGETRISKFLENKNIKHVSQKRFPECKDKNTLPFDFYISSRKILIEYQGRQHFEYVRHFHRSKKGFEDRKKKFYHG